MVTSYGTVVKFEIIKKNFIERKSFEEYKRIVGNKSVFTEKEIDSFYGEENLYVLELVYDHAFGEGNNVNHYNMNKNGIWAKCYPFQAVYTMEDFQAILALANQDIEKLIK